MHSLKSRESRSPFAGRLSRIAAETDLILTNPPACQRGLSPTFVDDQCCYSSDVGAYVLRGDSRFVSSRCWPSSSPEFQRQSRPFFAIGSYSSGRKQLKISCSM